MKRFRPLERIPSGSGISMWATLITAICVGCLPISSALASTHGRGGGNHVSGGHVSGAHALGGKSNHFSTSHVNSRIAGSNHFTGRSNVAKTHSSSGKVRNDSSNLGRHFNSGSQASFYSRSASSRTMTRHSTALHQHQSKAAINHHDSANRFISPSRDLARTKTGKAAINHRDSANRFMSTVRDSAPTSGHNARNRVNARVSRSNVAYNHSLTASYAQNLMNQRLNQISNRQWTGHGTFYTNHFDRDHHCWFRHSGSWWRCNYWGAHRYCNHLITVGFAPGLCWAWYDNICWGNIVIGMPLDLVDYYYPDPVYSSYADYNGDDAIVYYYVTDEGQYKRVTVVDGNVVEVQIVDRNF